MRFKRSLKDNFSADPKTAKKPPATIPLIQIAIAPFGTILLYVMAVQQFFCRSDSSRDYVTWSRRMNP